jgi:GDP-fucose protein O-fucosyltransferase
MGLTNQLFALFNGIGYAHSIGASVVAPMMFKSFEYSPDMSDDELMEMQAKKYGVDIDTFFDFNTLSSTISPLVKLVRTLPDHLKDAPRLNFYRLKTQPGSEAFLKEADDLCRYHVINIGFQQKTLHWSTPSLGYLRSLLYKGLKPSPQIARLVTIALEQLKQKVTATTDADGDTHSQLIGLHMRTEYDYRMYCMKEETVPHISMVRDWRECWVHPARMAELMHARGQLNSRTIVFVASGSIPESARTAFHSYGALMFNKQQLLHSIEIPSSIRFRDLWAAIDFFILRGLPTFVGSAYSSFSFAQREMKLLDGQPAYYYNTPPEFTYRDVMHLESSRWDVRPGVLLGSIDTDSTNTLSSRSSMKYHPSILQPISKLSLQQVMARALANPCTASTVDERNAMFKTDLIPPMQPFPTDPDVNWMPPTDESALFGSLDDIDIVQESCSQATVRVRGWVTSTAMQSYSRFRPMDVSLWIGGELYEHRLANMERLDVQQSALLLRPEVGFDIYVVVPLSTSASSLHGVVLPRTSVNVCVTVDVFASDNASCSPDNRFGQGFSRCQCRCFASDVKGYDVDQFDLLMHDLKC